MKSIFKILMLLAFLPGMMFAQEKVNKISIFKNGLVFFHKELKVDASTGTAELDKLPVAVASPVPNREFIPYIDDQLNSVMLGTVWFYGRKNRVMSSEISLHTVQQKRDITELQELLEANKGSKIKYKIYSGDESAEATISNVFNDIVLLSQKDKWVSLKISQIQYLEFIGKPSTEKTDSLQKKLLHLKFDKKSAKQEVDLYYFQKGMTWFPDYLIVIDDDKKAKITLRANILNDIEDIENAEVDLVVGVPTFEYSQNKSPLFSDESVWSFLNSYNFYNIDDMSGLANNVAQSAGGYAMRESMMAPMPTLDLNLKTNEDLFFYYLKDITLKKGGRALIDVLDTKSDYEDIYKVSLPSNDIRYSNNSGETVNDVWHSIRIWNNSRVPLTTGSAFVLKEEDGHLTPVSQGKLQFTPSGAQTEIKLTIAPDININSSDIEIKREEKAKKFDYWHDLITVEGKIEIENFKGKKVKLNIERIIEGELIESSVKWTHEAILQRINSKNKKNNVNWEIEADSGEKSVITYKYSFYVNN